MKCQKGHHRYLPIVITALITCQVPLCCTQAIWGNEKTKSENRADAVRALVSHLGLGEGSVIADIGAGNGRDTWVFAEIVGETGKVFAEEIDEDKVKSLKDSAKKKNLTQVIAMLGSTSSPWLLPNSNDLVYMNRVYHHFAKPREMLR